MTPVEQPRPLEGYEPFFGLREAPFSLAPDPRFLFASSTHATALAQVAYALQRREPLVVVTGEIGTGKTLLCRTLLQRLPGKTFLSVITDPLLGRDDLLKQMLQDFGVISKDRSRLAATSRHDLVEALQAFLSSLAPLQAHAVVIVDEAQHLQPDVLEQIRLLSNIDDQHGTALEIILVGQPDLEQLLGRPELRQLQQRVSRWLRLAALNRDEVTLYVEHRMARARHTEPASDAEAAEFAWDLIESTGAKRSVDFTADAIDAISELSHGVPRVINLLCDRSLEEAYTSRLRRIDGPLIHAAARELGIKEQGVRDTPTGLRLAARRAEVLPAESVWPAVVSDAEVTSEIYQPADEMLRPADEIASPADEIAQTGHEYASPAIGSLAQPSPSTKLPKYALAAVLALAAIAAILWSVRGGRATTAAPARPPQAVSSATRASGAPASSTPGAAGTPVTPVKNDQKPATIPGTPAVPGTATPPTAAPSSTSAPGGDQFELVVASFRTDARAASVAAEITAIGLPVRRRVSDGWQQVIAGPFASRTDAGAAQQRLDSAGLTGAQIVPATR